MKAQEAEANTNAAKHSAEMVGGVGGGALAQSAVRYAVSDAGTELYPTIIAVLGVLVIPPEVEVPDVVDTGGNHSHEGKKEDERFCDERGLRIYCSVLFQRRTCVSDLPAVPSLRGGLISRIHDKGDLLLPGPERTGSHQGVRRRWLVPR